MKKITIAILLLLGSFSMASAELGLRVGVSTNLAVFFAEGTDTDASNPTHAGIDGHNNTSLAQTEAVTAVVPFTSIMVEKSLPGALSRFSIGVDYVPEALESETVENQRVQAGAGQAVSDKLNTVQISFEDLTTVYGVFNVTEKFYVKAGAISVEMKTNENLATGGSYKDESLSGTMAGAGFEQVFGNGVFIRGEGRLIDIDNPTKQTSGDHTISVKNFEGASANFSIGKVF